MVGGTRGQLRFHGGSGPGLDHGNGRYWYEKQCLFKYYNIQHDKDETLYQIKDSIVAYVQENPFMINQTISGNGLAQAFKDFKYADILSVKVAFLADLSYSDYISCKISECAVLDNANITFVEV
jgi:hypothetical protein